MTVRAHPTALIEDGVSIGAGTSVWDNAHLRRGAKVGDGASSVGRRTSPIRWSSAIESKSTPGSTCAPG